MASAPKEIQSVRFTEIGKLETVMRTIEKMGGLPCLTPWTEEGVLVGVHVSTLLLPVLGYAPHQSRMLALVG